MQALGLVWHDDGAVSRHLEEVYTLQPEPAHSDARLLFNDWRQHNAEGGFIVGRHVPSRALMPLLAGLSLYEPIDNGQDFKIRLAGTSLRHRFGQDPTGLRLSDLFGEEQFAYHCTQMNTVGRTGQPFVLDVRAMRDERLRLHFELIGLRVLASDLRTPWIMTGQFFYHG